MTEKLPPAPIPASKAALREVILPLLDESDEPFDDDNLIDYGLDSVRMMALAARWRKVHGDIDFVMLAKNPTIVAWRWKSLSPRGEIMDFSGKNLVTGAGKVSANAHPRRWRLLKRERKLQVLIKRSPAQYPFATEVMDVADAAQVAQVCQRLLAERSDWTCWSMRREFCAWA